jgi:hypothetical protein
MSAGKGDKPRPVNKKEYNKNFDNISWERNNSKVLEVKTKKGKQIIVYKNL